MSSEAAVLRKPSHAVKPLSRAGSDAIRSLDARLLTLRWRLAAGVWRPRKPGSRFSTRALPARWRLETGDWRLETGDWRLVYNYH